MKRTRVLQVSVTEGAKETVLDFGWLALNVLLFISSGLIRWRRSWLL